MGTLTFKAFTSDLITSIHGFQLARSHTFFLHTISFAPTTIRSVASVEGEKVVVEIRDKVGGEVGDGLSS